MKPLDIWKVTPEMQKAGSEMASVLMDAGIAKCMDGLGGSRTWSDWLAEDVPNRDLAIEYLDDKIDSVTAIYLAMDRARSL